MGKDPSLTLTHYVMLTSLYIPVERVLMSESYSQSWDTPRSPHWRRRTILSEAVSPVLDISVHTPRIMEQI